MKRDYKLELILSGVVHNKALFCELASSIKEHIFDANNEYEQFWARLRKYYDEYKACPSVQEFLAYSDLSFEFTNDIYGTYGRGMDAEMVKNAFYKVYQHEKIRNFIFNTTDSVERGAYTADRLRTEVKDILLKTVPVKYEYKELGKNAVAYYKYARDFRLFGISPTSLDCLNRVAAGGQAIRESLLFMAPSSRGKTTFLVNELYQSLLNDEKVLYLSMEDEQENIFTRLTDRVLLMTRAEQRREEALACKYVDKFFRYVRSPIFMYKKPGTFSVEDLDLFVEDYELRTGITIDTIIVDYIDKFKKSHYRDLQDVDKDRKCSDNFRAIGISRNKRVKTAVQTGRGAIARQGMETEDSSEADMAGGFGKYETFDIVLGYHQTKKGMLKSQGDLSLLKVRQTGGRGNKYTITMAPWIGLMTDEPFKALPESKKNKLVNPFIKTEGFIGLTEKKGGGKKGEGMVKSVQEAVKKIDTEGVQI
jgi:hypothetical protein